MMSWIYACVLCTVPNELLVKLPCMLDAFVQLR
eukprot:COSAG01_NODE_7790_length_3056_cov_2.849510_3_plen_33_part_00